jgi:hypothetical protein
MDIAENSMLYEQNSVAQNKAVWNYTGYFLFISCDCS